MRYNPGGKRGGMAVTKRYSWDDLAGGELTDAAALNALAIMGKRASFFTRIWKTVRTALANVFTSEVAEIERDIAVSEKLNPSLEPVVAKRSTVPVYPETKDRIKEIQGEDESLSETMDRIVGAYDIFEMRRRKGGFAGGLFKKKKPSGGPGDIMLGALGDLGLEDI